jgi:hypothetical protein
LPMTVTLSGGTCAAAMPDKSKNESCHHKNQGRIVSIPVLPLDVALAGASPHDPVNRRAATFPTH